MDFKKKFDHEDINMFLPDNLTLGRSDYFKSKFGDNMPDYVCDILEIDSRNEYNDPEENQQILNDIVEKQRQENDKLIKEYEERCTTTTVDTEVEDVSINVEDLNIEEIASKR